MAKPTELMFQRILLSTSVPSAEILQFTSLIQLLHPLSEQLKREAKKQEDELMEDRLYTQLAKRLGLEENRIVSKDEAKRLLESPNGK